MTKGFAASFPVLMLLIASILASACGNFGLFPVTPTPTPTASKTPTLLPATTTTPTLTVTATWLVGDLGWGEISGTVYDAWTKTPLRGAKVTCHHSSYTSPVRCFGMKVTDTNGRFVFPKAFFHDTDLVTLFVNAPGYQTQVLDKEHFTEPGWQINIPLVPVGPTPASNCDHPPCGGNG